MTVTDLITPDVVRSYARAVIKVARTCDRLQDEGYAITVVPSRGASPIVRTAASYRRSILKPAVASAERLRLWKRGLTDPLSATIHIPFTADAGELGVADLKSTHIRAFWARVVAAIARGDVNNPYYRFYRFHRDVVCRVGHHDNMEHLLNTERFIFVDTVVSGRAVVEIADAFDALGMDQIHYLLLLDENGDRIYPQYAARLHQLEAQGRATLVRLDSLFTEDQGPAVSGIWSVVMPSVMEMARDMVPAFSDGVVGAGLYYHEVRMRDDESNGHFTSAIGRLHTILYQAMHAVTDLNEVAEDLEHRELFFEDTLNIDHLQRISSIMDTGLDLSVEEYVHYLAAESLFEADATRGVAHDRVLSGVTPRATLDVSPSHCLRLDIDADAAAALIRTFKLQLTEAR
ncbi:hypothetical protein [Brevundimonas sp.]|uniref:hypothetical protein n=1 Tax=unclassified Brevundimonas TaxID=2622653 RepID=UPI003B00B567